MSIKNLPVEKCSCQARRLESGTSPCKEMGVKRARDFVLTLEEDDVASQSETESEAEEVATKTKKRKVDEELNPEFEFDG